jgi:tetratricopeptide (TPR) repeat protein
MSKFMTKRLHNVLAIVFFLLVTVCSPAPVSAKDSWTSVRSKNFLLLGNAGEKEIRRVAVRLEQFREVFSLLFPTMKVNAPVPTRVVVFKNGESFRPFRLFPNTVAYFQPGPDVNYITLTLTSDSRSEADPYFLIFHEYTHLLINNTSGSVPTWFNEGLAEYYSTFNISDDQKVVLGKPIANHVYLLRQNKMLPLRTLFQVDHNSPYYNERDKQSIFYAESWALLHYLVLGKNGQRVAQLGKFIDWLTAGVPMEKAFQQAFAITFESMEKQLRAYIQRDSYPISTGHFASKVGYDTAMESALISDAETQAYLGDLLLHSNRPGSEAYLQRALALDPNLAMANASMGMLQVRQGKAAEARKSLERAVAANSQNYLTHYYYAYALSREGNFGADTIMTMAPETAAKMRTELKRAIELRPDFPESYSLLAFVNLVTNTELDESLVMLKRAFAASPGKNDLVFMMAQIHLRKDDFKAAHQLLDKLIANNNDAEIHQRSKSLLAQLEAVEAQRRTMKEAQAEDARRNPTVRDFSADTPEKYDPSAALRESLRSPAAGETQALGKLTRIDCDAKGITFTVRISGRLLKLKTDNFAHVQIVTFSEDSRGEITCGPRKPENSVVVCYLPETSAGAKINGVIKSLEFVPPDFKLNANP